MQSKQVISLLQKLTTLLGGAFLIFIVIGSWVPSSCPIVRKVFLGNCPNPAGVQSFPKSDKEREIKRIPNQEVFADRLEISVKAQEKRNKTGVHFYHFDTSGQVVAMLQLKASDGTTKDLSLITHRVLRNLSWPAIRAPEVRLFQESETYSSIEQFVKQPPAANRLAADAAAAALYGLREDQYTPLEPLEKLDGISYVLTSYTTGEPDGSWEKFDHVYDFSDVHINESNDFTLVVKIIQGISNDDPFRVATVHVDYAKSNQ